MSATTRRDALRGAGIAGLAGILSATTGTAKAATPKGNANPDAALIAGCNRLIVHHAAVAALMDKRHTLADEARTEPELTRLLDKQRKIESEFYNLPPPETFEGVIAMARCLLVCAPPNSSA